MDNEKLIELVSEYKFLYDLNDKKYCDNQKKDQAWDAIGKKLKSDGKECKKAWGLLRDAFRRAGKKRKATKSGQASVPGKKWKYEDEMSFLSPYIKERSTRGICPIPTTPAFDSDDNANEEALVAEKIAQSPDFGEQTTGTLLTTLSPSETNSQPKRTKQRKNRTHETPSTVLVKYIIDSEKDVPPDDIEQFMAGITTILRSFPARDRAIAKAKIFEIVSQMEINILTPENAPQCL